jgi:hypothetical protein
MKKLSFANTCLLTLVILFLSACGGGGGGGAAAPQSRTAVVTLGTATTQAILAGTTINGYDLTIELPTGVTVRSSVTPTTDPGVVVTSGTATWSTIASVYTAAIGTTTPGKVRIMIANENGIAAGEFSKVTCIVAAGLSLSSSETFTHSFIATGIDASNSTVDLSSYLALTATVAIQ